MRRYVINGVENAHDIKDILDVLSDENTNVSLYRESFISIGRELGKVLRQSLPLNFADSTLLACTSEDADWLARGVLDGLRTPSLPVAVFWTKRYSSDYIHITPIVRIYQDKLSGDCETLIVVKSIISSSCVVKTQLLRLISSITPKRIFIVAPVMYKDAQPNLLSEFPIEISDKIEFITFAIDDKKEGRVIIPGIGGWVYPRLGFESEEIKNRYIPDMVRERMAL